MIKEYVGYIDIFSKEECIDIVNRIDSLRKEWINLGSYDIKDGIIGYPPLWTLGAASYRDGVKSLKIYHKLKTKENETLIDNFSDVYDRLLDKIVPVIGDSKLENSLALPGFHIFAEKNTVKEKVSVKITDDLFRHIHKDGLNDLHYDHLSKIYSNVDINKIISITVSVQLPLMGSGICIWDESVSKLHSNDSFAKEIIDEKIYSEYPGGEPHIVPYELGSAFCFSGGFDHQIAPNCTGYPGDRRITLQAHGIVCDGAWRLFF